MHLLLQKRNILGLLIVTIFLLLTRFWRAEIFPAALTHDEIVYAVQAKSFATQGTSLNQEFKPWSLQPMHPLYAEFPALLITPFFLISNNLLLSTRLLSILMGITFPFLLALFSYGIWKNKQQSYVVLVVSSLNPLLWQMSRLTYDAVISTYFYLLGAVLLFFLKGKKMLFAVIPLTIGFFCYQGYKLVFIPFLILLTFLLFRSKKSFISSRFFLLVAGFCVALFVSYVTIILPHQKVENRWHITVFADQKFQSDNVNDERRIALQTPINKFFSNKAVIVGKFVAGRFLQAYSPGYLFLYGEPSQSGFSAWGYGWFHFFEAPLLLIGLFTVFHRKESRRAGFLLILFIAASTLPATINSGDPWYLLRMFFPNVLLILFISWGGYTLYRLSLPGKVFFVVLYVVGFISFGYHYYIRYPVSGLNLSYFSERIMSEYIARVSKLNPERKIIVYTIDPPVLFWIYLLYTNGISKQTVDAIAQIEKSRVFTIGNITFSTDCVDLSNETDLLVAESLQVATPCDYDNRKNLKIDRGNFQSITERQQHTNLTIQSVTDNGAFWRIYNNTLCDKKTLGPFVYVQTLQDLRTNLLSNEQFCSKWITNVY